jgi:hypothetical protein
VQLFPALFDCFTLNRLDEDRKLKKIDTEAVSGDFNGHSRNQAVQEGFWPFSHHNEHQMLQNEAELSHK